jgi:putative sterol carrier protein
MGEKFPSPEWLNTLFNKLNSDAHYAVTAKNWEGDMCVLVKPGGPLKEQLIYYFDLWHGKCKKVEILQDISLVHPKFVLTANYDDIANIVSGKLDPMTAMMTRKLQVHGSLAYMMRNVPTVLDFVRCLREITTEIL